MMSDWTPDKIFELVDGLRARGVQYFKLESLEIALSPQMPKIPVSFEPPPEERESEWSVTEEDLMWSART